MEYNLAVLLAKDLLPKLVTKGTSSVLCKFERKISGQGAVRAKRTHFIHFKWRYGWYY